jgi:hypothetical protein
MHTETALHAEEGHMEAALQPPTRRQDSSLHVIGARPSAPAQSLTATANYRLSDAGRKASLLIGGDGREHQELAIEIPITRLHLVHVDPNGMAQLKLRPRYDMDANQRILRIDAPPAYDVPPTIEGLFQDAARNHELESLYFAHRTAARANRQETEEEWRRRVAQEFLADQSQRAMTSPAPTSRHCVIRTERGRVEFDAKRDRGVVRHVPLEAFRRYQADLRERKARAYADRASHATVHAERERIVHDWIATHGTLDQRERLVAGVLPIEEGIEAMAADAFRALAQFPAYEVNGPGPGQLQAYLRQFPPYADAVVTPLDLLVLNRALPTATPAQWSFLRQVQAAVPDAKVLLRERCLVWTHDPQAPKLRHVTVLALKKVGPITLRREFWVSETPSSVPLSPGEESMTT